ncbi:hypothetical protein SCLCIDRAFT_27171 [Scleroderma citrinum Foug A]|uniref:Hydantoinase A/oxoprolinase domain-containing protein n=1 Tax=Scleroderma citrinum Foug A TaxID=1036808 RepID=A0A0C2ZCW8_9AGAM|nr:hypothetical protein SCLCIDRAFT_27171 [Scleroderma citrinum Foug A]
MRGAAFLASLNADISKQSALVVDIGGTTTDLGMLLFLSSPGSCPSQSLWRLVKLLHASRHQHWLGWGISCSPRLSDAQVTVGPDSVGHAITSQALVLGGSTLTATDVAVGSQARKTE